MIDVTLNHLNALKRLVVSNPQLSELLEECTKQIHTAYSSMLIADFNAMRQSLCTFFQDRRVKVSLFLHDHTQNHDGSIVVPSGGTLPVGAQLPGTVRYFQGGVETGRECLPCATASSWAINTGTRTALGANLYEKDRPGADSAPVAEAGMAPASAHSASPAPAETGMPQDSHKVAAAVGELKLLASLIGAQPAPSNETFKLENLFGAGVFSKDSKTDRAGVIQIDGSAPGDHHRGLDSIRQQFQGLDLGAQQAPQDERQDLMDLMDGAGTG
jgi:hypothetical protein